MSGLPRIEHIDRKKLKPKRHHGYSVILFILGSLLPPLAVAARFGIGTDFFINLVMTLCGYFPGHFHNFYIQNIRNNKNNKRTPKWAVRYGLIDDSHIKKKAKKSEWSKRYDERLPNSTLDDQPFEDGQIPDRERVPTDPNTPGGEALWSREEEGFYGQPGASQSVASTSESSGGRWHYPANFDDTEPTTPVKGKSKSGKKKDRWARTEDAYAEPQPKKKSKRSKSKNNLQDDNSDRLSGREGPEDAVGGLYGPSRSGPTTGDRRVDEDESLAHQF